MANQSYITIELRLFGDGSSLTATIVLDSTPMYLGSNVANFKAIPDSVNFLEIRYLSGNPVPATATLSKNGKQVLITFSSVFSEIVLVTFDLGYNV